MAISNSKLLVYQRVFRCCLVASSLLLYCWVSPWHPVGLHLDRLETVQHDIWIYEGGPHWNDGLDWGNNCQLSELLQVVMTIWIMDGFRVF